MALHPLPQVWVRSSRHFLGQLFSSPLREHATLSGAEGRDSAESDTCVG